MTAATAPQGGELSEVVGILLAIFLPPIGLVVATTQLIVHRHNHRLQMHWSLIYVVGWITTFLLLQAV